MTWIQTNSGLEFDLERPESVYVDHRDIAHALARLCRFTGHVKKFYSVAQHSVHVSERVPREVAFVGLMHDAAEAYTNDLSAPLKRLPQLAGYREIERRVWKSVAQRFDLPDKLPPEVQRADLRMLMTEKRDLMASTVTAWNIDADPYEDLDLTEPWDVETSKARFLERFAELYQA